MEVYPYSFGNLNQGVAYAYANDFSRIFAPELKFPMVNYWNDLLRQKLLSIDTSRSPELKRYVLWNLHRLPRFSEWHTQPESFDRHDKRLPEIQIHFPCRELYDIDGKELCTDVEDCGKPRVINDILPRVDSSFFLGPFSRGVQYSRLVLFHIISSLIDKWVDFWNNFAEARLSWQSLTAAFREFLNRNLRFKPLFIPLRLTPRSLHPIESAA